MESERKREKKEREVSFILKVFPRFEKPDFEKKNFQNFFLRTLSPHQLRHDAVHVRAPVRHRLLDARRRVDRRDRLVERLELQRHRDGGSGVGRRASAAAVARRAGASPRRGSPRQGFPSGSLGPLGCQLKRADRHGELARLRVEAELDLGFHVKVVRDLLSFFPFSFCFS